MLERVTFLTSRISLLLNPTEEDHGRFVDLVNQFNKTFDETKGAPNAIGPIRKDITQLARTIPKREWERTKSEPDEW